MLVSLPYPKKNMIKQQDSSPFKTAGKSLKRITFCMHGYYTCVYHEGTICKSRSKVDPIFIRWFCNRVG